MSDPKDSVPRVTIGILTHNGARYISKITPILKKLTYPEIEIIVVDNASTDTTIEQLQAAEVPHLKIIRNHSNLGYCTGKNQIVSKATGKYVLLLDEDTELTTADIIEQLIRAHQETSAGLVTCALANAGEHNTPYIGGFWSAVGYGYRPSYPIERIQKSQQSYIQIHACEGQVVFFQKAHFVNIGMYDEAQPYFLDTGDVSLRSIVVSNKPNICLLRHIAIHHGVERKVNTRQWAWKLRYMYPGTMRMLLKNLTWQSVLLYSVPIFTFYFFGSIAQTIKRRSLRVLASYVWSVAFFIQSLPDTLQQRRAIQAKRIISNDKFLSDVSRPSAQTI